MAKIDFSVFKKAIEQKGKQLNEEHEKILSLPDDEFLSPDTTKKLERIHEETLSLVKLANCGSKYFEKHYQVEEAELDEVQCGHCKKIFAVDYKWLDYFTANVDEDWARCYCPYCGKIKQWCI